MQDQPESDQLEKERLALEAERAALEAERAALRAARAASDAGAGGQADTGIGTGRLVGMIIRGLAAGLLWGFFFGAIRWVHPQLVERRTLRADILSDRGDPALAHPRGALGEYG